MNRSQMHRFVLASTLLLGLAAPALAQSLTQFQNGQVADASAVNANFQTVLGAAEAAQAVAGQAQSIASSVSGAVTNAQATADQAQATATSALTTAEGAATSAGRLTGAITAVGTSIGIGLPATTSPEAKLDVRGDILIGGGGIGAALTGGDRLLFGFPSLNTDAIFFQRFNPVANESVLRLVLGDDPLNAVDAFHIGTSGNADKFSFFSNGRLGIGTTTPRVSLEVNGEVRLGTGGNFRPIASGDEQLGFLRGQVTREGSTVGPAFYSVSGRDDGVYLITANRSFAANPTVTACVVEDGSGFSPDNTITVEVLGFSSFRVRTYDITGLASGKTQLQDTAFSFIAIGPR